jgi:hypothetical protein
VTGNKRNDRGSIPGRDREREDSFHHAQNGAVAHEPITDIRRIKCAENEAEF